MTLTCTHFGNLRAIYYRLNDAIAGSVIVLYAAAGIAHDIKCSVNNQLGRLWTVLNCLDRLQELLVSYIIFFRRSKVPTSQDQSIYSSVMYSFLCPLEQVWYVSELVTVDLKLSVLSSGT